MAAVVKRLARWLGGPLHVREPDERLGRSGEEAGAGAGAASGAIAEAAAIVVLGAPLDARDQLTEVGRERAAAAADLWRRGGGQLLITSGGVTRGEARSEADALADELVALGVPRQAIIVEDKARSTAENARYCAELMRAAAAACSVQASATSADAAPAQAASAQAASTQAAPEATDALPLGPVWLVTQPFHGRRARLCFRRAGVEAWVWPIADSLELRDPRRALKWSLREYLAWAKSAVVRR